MTLEIIDSETYKVIASYEYNELHQIRKGLEVRHNIRLVGDVILGDELTIGEDVIICGPIIIKDYTTISKGSFVIPTSVIDGIPTIGKNEFNCTNKSPLDIPLIFKYLFPTFEDEHRDTYSQFMSCIRGVGLLNDSMSDETLYMFYMVFKDLTRIDVDMNDVLKTLILIWDESPRLPMYAILATLVDQELSGIAPLKLPDVLEMDMDVEEDALRFLKAILLVFIKYDIPSTLYPSLDVAGAVSILRDLYRMDNK